ncbi:MAG: radical SAM protein [Oscillospiraceae bacterium]|jgi:nitrogen fixation protein NifB|nr:radical SAM protein [Oscillospiraceae bacterium]
MSATLRELTQSHPCYAQGKPGTGGRVHLPVSPGCNIFCRFCDRKLCADEKRPGVARTVQTPQAAMAHLRKAVHLCPDIKVIGIAGPGETLHTPHALETFRLAAQEFPTLLKCMSTNGLLLAEKADALIALNIDALTVTVNAVDPHILAQICDGIVYQGQTILGAEAADKLIQNQLAGIRKVAGAGMTVKINIVLIPGVNDQHVPLVAKSVHQAGAQMVNVIPLIPRHKCVSLPPPTCGQIETARAHAEEWLSVFRHCARCRADAAGVPGGRDFAPQIYGDTKRAAHTFSHG